MKLQVFTCGPTGENIPLWCYTHERVNLPQETFIQWHLLQTVTSMSGRLDYRLIVVEFSQSTCGTSCKKYITASMIVLFSHITNSFSYNNICVSKFDLCMYQKAKISF